MARLPIVGADDETWGDLLNTYESLEHNGDGTHKAISLQGGSHLYSGTGVPANGMGVNGDLYFRFDGTVGSTVYHKEAGAWRAFTEAGSLSILDEGLLQGAISSINFVGAGVSASAAAGVATVTVPTPTVAVQDEGTPAGAASTLNFTGAGVTASFAGGVATVNIPTSPAGNLGSGIFNVLDYGALGDGTTDDRAACQAAITAAAGNGTVYFPPGKTYYLNSTGPLLLNASATNLILSGYGATIKLSANAKSFLSFNRTTNNQIWQNTTVQGFNVDGNNLSGAGTNHVVIGTMDSTQFNMSFRNFLIQDIYAYNVYTDTAASPTAGRWVIAFYTQSDGSGTLAGNLVENMIIRRCRLEGGVLGVIIGAGTPAGLFRGNFLVEDCSHDTMVTPTAFAPMSNFHFGSYGRISGTIRRCVGKRSSDDGIEANNADPIILVEDCRGENSWNGFYAVVNYSTPTNNDASRFIFRNCSYKVDTVNGSASAGWNVGFAGTNDHNEIILEGCTAHDLRTFIRADFSYAAINIYGGVVIKRLIIKNFLQVHSGWTWNPGSAAQTTEGLTFIEVNGAGSTLLLDGFRTLVRGTQTTAGAPNAVFVYPLRIVPKSATSRVEMRAIEAEYAVTNAFIGTSSMINFAYNGDATGCSVRSASLHGLKLKASTDTQPTGIWVGSAAALTINDRINVDELDFSGVTATDIVKVYSADATNLAKIFKYTTTAW